MPFALLVLSGAAVLWLAGRRGDTGPYALAAVEGALAVLYGAEVFFGALSRLSLRAAARRAGGRSAQFWEDNVLLQSPGESARLAYAGITDAWQGPQGLCLFWGRRALPVPGDALEAEQFHGGMQPPPGHRPPPPHGQNDHLRELIGVILNNEMYRRRCRHRRCRRWW